MALGDILIVKRGVEILGKKYLRGRVYKHVGFDCGDGTVIHYAEPSKRRPRGRVVRVTYRTFAKGDPVFTNPCPSTVDITAAYARAQQRIGEEKYALWSNNCEHLVTWCWFGEGYSEQIDNVKDLIRSAFPMIAGPIGTWAAAALAANAFQSQIKAVGAVSCAIRVTGTRSRRGR